MFKFVSPKVLPCNHTFVDVQYYFLNLHCFQPKVNLSCIFCNFSIKNVKTHKNKICGRNIRRLDDIFRYI